MFSICHFMYLCQISTINMKYLILYVHKCEIRYCFSRAVKNMPTSYQCRSKTNISIFMKISHLIYAIERYTQGNFQVFWRATFYFTIDNAFQNFMSYFLKTLPFQYKRWMISELYRPILMILVWKDRPTQFLKTVRTFSRYLNIWYVKYCFQKNFLHVFGKYLEKIEKIAIEQGASDRIFLLKCTLPWFLFHQNRSVSSRDHSA